MIYRNLEHKLQMSGGAAKMARNTSIGPFYIPKVPAEFSNWRDEQVAWRETVALLDLTHHMSDLFVEGPDVVQLFSDLGVNSFAGFRPNKAKQFVCCNPDGYLIGDGILFFLDEHKISLLGLPMAHNWVQFHAQSGRYKVTVTRDDATESNTTSRMRRLYRFQIQGPAAVRTLEEAVAGPVPEIKFFNIGEFTIAGCKVRALRHGMSSSPGFELFGPYADIDKVRTAIVAAGAQFGLQQVGYLAYPTTTLESGWIPDAVPAIYTGEALRAYREWLPANGYEGLSSLGGSFDSEEIADYYLTPYELGYGPFVKFDHEFIGRKALELMGERSRRRKVTLAWNKDDVMSAMRTMFEKGPPARYLNLPWTNYPEWTYDKVLLDGEFVGLSKACGYSYNERVALSLAVVDGEVPIGAEVSLLWGEAHRRADGPSAVEEHVQVRIRAVVSPCPYSEMARTSYAKGWRTTAARSQ